MGFSQDDISPAAATVPPRPIARPAKAAPPPPFGGPSSPPPPPLPPPPSSSSIKAMRRHSTNPFRALPTSSGMSPVSPTHATMATTTTATTAAAAAAAAGGGLYGSPTAPPPPSFLPPSPLHLASMVGSYEESILRGRMSTAPSRPFDFVAQIGVLGLGACRPSLRCPAHVVAPFPAVFYTYPKTDAARSPGLEDGPSPYVGVIDLENTLPPPPPPPQPAAAANTVREEKSHRKRHCGPTASVYGGNGGGDNETRREESPHSVSPMTPTVGSGSGSGSGIGIGGGDGRLKRKKRSSSSVPKTPPGGSYRIPQKGQLQIVIKNPNKTAVKLFLVPYDLEGMEPGTKTFVRQRSYSLGPIIELPVRPKTGEDGAASAAATPAASSASPPTSPTAGAATTAATAASAAEEVAKAESAAAVDAAGQDRPTLRYLIHLQICCLARDRFFLYKSIRVVFANRVPDGKERLRHEIQLPEPRYSAYKPGRDPPSSAYHASAGGTPYSFGGSGSFYGSGSGSGERPIARKRRSSALGFGFSASSFDAIDGIGAAQQYQPPSPSPYALPAPAAAAAVATAAAAMPADGTGNAVRFRHTASRSLDHGVLSSFAARQSVSALPAGYLHSSHHHCHGYGSGDVGDDGSIRGSGGGDGSGYGSGNGAGAVGRSVREQHGEHTNVSPNSKSYSRYSNDDEDDDVHGSGGSRGTAFGFQSARRILWPSTRSGNEAPEGTAAYKDAAAPRALAEAAHEWSMKGKRYGMRKEKHATGRLERQGQEQAREVTTVEEEQQEEEKKEEAENKGKKKAEEKGEEEEKEEKEGEREEGEQKYAKLSRGDVGYGGNIFARLPSNGVGARAGAGVGPAQGLLARRLRGLDAKRQQHQQSSPQPHEHHPQLTPPSPPRRGK